MLRLMATQTARVASALSSSASLASHHATTTSTFSHSKRRRRVRSLSASLALVAALGACWQGAPSFVSTLPLAARLGAVIAPVVFPSGDVTAAKLAWLALGLLLAAHHLLDLLYKLYARVRRRQEAWQLFLADENTPQKLQRLTQPVTIDSELFAGHARFVTSSSGLDVQLQGHFKRVVPVGSEVFLAVELPQASASQHSTRWTQLWKRALLAVVKRLWRHAHVLLGSRIDDKTNAELLRQSLQVNPQDDNGHLNLDKAFKTRSFRFRSSHVDLVRWRLVDLPLEWLMSDPVWLAAYVAVPSKRESPIERQGQTKKTTDAHRQYVFRVAVYRRAQTAMEAQCTAVARRHQQPQQHQVERGSPIAPWSTSTRGRRSGGHDGVPRELDESCRAIGADASALARLSFSLDAWVELVDPEAGRRKVSYLLSVVETGRRHQHTVLRSAATVKNALLLLRVEHQLDQVEAASSGLDDDEPQDEGECNLKEAMDWKKLVVESREYLYKQIERETGAVARTMQVVATSCLRPQQQRCYQQQLEKATLFRCLTAASRLPSVPNYQAIGVQMSKAHHAAMHVVSEVGIYRLHGAGDGATPLLRQEWLVVTPRHLRFFRSFSVMATLRVPITHVLRVRCVGQSGFLDGSKCAGAAGTSGRDEEAGVPRWFCVEVHLALEILTLFVETAAQCEQLVTALQRLTNDDGEIKAPAATAAEAVAASALFSPLSLDVQQHPVCLNQRTLCPAPSLPGTGSPTMLSLVRQSLVTGLELFAMGAEASRRRLHQKTMLRFLDAVDALNALDLNEVAQASHEDRMAVALNLYHTLFVHAVLVFGHPRSHAQWKRMQTVPCYLVRVGPSRSVRFTLADIQRVMLRSPVPVTLEASGITRSFSQNALRDFVAAAGDTNGGAVSNLATEMASTSIRPSSSRYIAVGNAPMGIPPLLAVDRADFRASLALQLNSSPPPGGSVGVMRVYSGGQRLHEQLDATCATFLSRELRLDDAHRIIYMPRVCQWYHLSHRELEDADVIEDLSRSGCTQRLTPLTHRRRRSSSSSTGGMAALSGSYSFYCLQRLLGFMEVEQHHRVQHLLLGAGDECRIEFDEFWTKPSRSAAANLLSSAGAAALAAFRSGNASVVARDGDTNGQTQESKAPSGVSAPTVAAKTQRAGNVRSYF